MPRYCVPSHRRLSRAGKGLIAAIVIAAITAGLAIASQAPFGKRMYSGDFAHAAGLRPGDAVKVAGIAVGEVVTTKLNGASVTVTMRVDADVSVATDGYATIKLSTLLGQRYVDLVPGESHEPAPGGKIGLRTGNKVPYNLEQTIEAGTPILDGVDADVLSEGLSTLADQLQGAPLVAAPVFESLSQMAQVLTSRREQIQRLLDDTRSLTRVVNDSSDSLALLVGQGRHLMEKASAREQLLTRLLDGLAELAEQAREIAVENDDQFAPVMVSIGTITEGLEKNRANLRRTLEVLAPTVRMTNNVLGDGPYANGYLPWGMFPDNWLCLARIVDGCV